MQATPPHMISSMAAAAPSPLFKHVIVSVSLLLATVMLAPQGFVLGVGKFVVDRWTGRRRREGSPALTDASRLQSDET